MRKLYAAIIIGVLLATFMPTVLSADQITFTLTPAGTVNIEVNQSTWTPVVFITDTYSTSTTWARLNNSGNVQVDVTVNVSNTTDWHSGATAAHNQFSMRYIFAQETPFTDGFESDLSKWDGNGETNWERQPWTPHTGSYSAYADKDNDYLTTDDIDTSSYNSFTISFWSWDDGVGTGTVLLQLWNGTAYVTVLDVSAIRSDGNDQTWVQSYYNISGSQYMSTGFYFRFNSAGIPFGPQIFIDDVSVYTTPETSMGYAPVTFVNDLEYDDTQDFGLKIIMPTSSSTNNNQTGTITFSATAD